MLTTARFRRPMNVPISAFWRQCMKRLLFIVVAIACVAVAASLGQSSQTTSTVPYTGQWLLDQGRDGSVQVTLRYTLDEPERHWNWSHSFTAQLSELPGLSAADLNAPGGKRVTFKIVRDAGSFNAEGWMQNGQGSGHYTFEPNPQFATEMEKRGLGTPT